MKLVDIKEKEGTLKKLKNLLASSDKKVHGVSYTNSFFSQRYLCRSNALVDNISSEDNEVKLTVTTRLEKVGLLEIENTLDMLVLHKAGDIPGFAPEGIFEDEETDRPHIPETISVKQHLFSVDILLIIKEPTITYKEFTIAGSKFTLVNINHKLDEDFEQTVTLLFGEKDKLYFFSHFYNKDLNLRDMKLILSMLVENNLTGKAITGVKLESLSGVSSGLFPMEGLISSYYTVSKDIIFNTTTGYIRLSHLGLQDYKLTCVPHRPTGAYRLDLESKNDTIRLYLE